MTKTMKTQNRKLKIRATRTPPTGAREG
jgi:hypothetical protein